MTAGKATFALVGTFAMIAAGKTIVTEDNIDDPAPQMNQALLAAAQAKYAVVPAAIPPILIDTTDVLELAQAAKGADLLFDVQSTGGDFRYLPFNWSHYIVDSGFKFRIVDVAAQKLIGEGFCRQSTQDDKVHPTRDELLADQASRLKEILNAQRDKCAKDFQEKVLAIGAQRGT